MIQEIIEGLTRILGPIATLSKERRELKDSALRAIANALDETFLYYRDLQNGMDRNPDREALLVKYWSAAAIPIRHFDVSLAETCDMKAEYWVSPYSYNNDDIQNLGIGLDNVRQAYRKLLKPSFSSAGKRKL